MLGCTTFAFSFSVIGTSGPGVGPATGIATSPLGVAEEFMLARDA